MFGTTKTGKIHLFTSENECLCDLNIKIKNKVSGEYVKAHKNNLCLTCAKLQKEIGELNATN